MHHRLSVPLVATHLASCFPIVAPRLNQRRLIAVGTGGEARYALLGVRHVASSRLQGPCTAATGVVSSLFTPLHGWVQGCLARSSVTCQKILAGSGDSQVWAACLDRSTGGLQHWPVPGVCGHALAIKAAVGRLSAAELSRHAMGSRCRKLEAPPSRVACAKVCRHVGPVPNRANKGSCDRQALGGLERIEYQPVLALCHKCFASSLESFCQHCVTRVGSCHRIEHAGTPTSASLKLAHGRSFERSAR